MLKFFRLIRKGLLREGKTTRYLAYAAGEIILVVVGILIALQINNWNENRKLEKQEQEMFAKILVDLHSDSLFLVNALVAFKRHQDLHYQLYYETRGVATYDSTFEYGLLRWTVPFELIVKENYQPIADKIMNETVRDNLTAYFRREEMASYLGVAQFTDLKLNLVRPYMTSNGINDVDAIFSTPRYKGNDLSRVLNYERIKAQLKVPEFGQLLFELRAKTAASIASIDLLLAANSQLQKTIQQALRK